MPEKKPAFSAAGTKPLTAKGGAVRPFLKFNFD